MIPGWCFGRISHDPHTAPAAAAIMVIDDPVDHTSQLGEDHNESSRQKVSYDRMVQYFVIS